MAADGPKKKNASRILRSRGCCGSAFGSPAILAKIGFRPVALRLRLSPDLPLSSGTDLLGCDEGGVKRWRGTGTIWNKNAGAPSEHADSTIGDGEALSIAPLVLSGTLQ